MKRRFGHPLILSFALALLLFHLWFFRADVHSGLEGTNDFPSFYANAEMVREGLGRSLFQFGIENRYVHRISPVAVPPLNHLPYELLFYLPLTFLSYRAAYLVCTGGNFILVFLIARVLRPHLENLSGLLPVSLALFAFLPIWFCLLQGQDSILLLFLYSLAFACVRRSHEFAAGFLLSLGLFKPELILPFILASLIAEKRKIMWGFLPGCALVLGISAAIVGRKGLLEYAHVLLQYGNEPSVAHAREFWHFFPGLMANLRGFFTLLLGSKLSYGIFDLVLLTSSLALVVWAGWKWRKARVQESSALKLGFSLNVVVTILVSFHLNVHDLTLLILPVLFFADYLAGEGSQQRPEVFGFITAAVILLLSPLHFILIYYEKESLMFLPILSLAILLARQLDRGLPAALAA